MARIPVRPFIALLGGLLAGVAVTVPASGGDTDASAGDTNRGWPVLAQAHDLQRAEKAEALGRCPEDPDCGELFAAVASASRTALFTGEVDPSTASWPETVTCAEPLQACLGTAFPDAHRLRGPEDVTVLRPDGHLARYAPDRVFTEDGTRALLLDAPRRTTLTRVAVGRERDPLARSVLAALPPQTGHARANALVGPADRRVQTASGTRWMSSTPVTRTPTVACADGRLLREPLDAHGVAAVPEALPFGLRQTEPAWRYTLPCDAVLVIGAGIEGIDGPMWTPRPLTPVPDGPGRFRVAGLRVEAETVWTPQPGHPPVFGACSVHLAGRVERARDCRPTVVGDLNGDGRTDAWIELTGEMGCGGGALYLSDPWGPHRRTSLELWDC